MGSFEKCAYGSMMSVCMHCTDSNFFALTLGGQQSTQLDEARVCSEPVNIKEGGSAGSVCAKTYIGRGLHTPICGVLRLSAVKAPMALSIPWLGEDSIGLSA